MFNKVMIMLITIFPREIFSCAVCYGDPQSPMSQGMSMGVLTLMGFIFFVLSIIIYSIISIAIRTKNINNS